MNGFPPRRWLAVNNFALSPADPEAAARRARSLGVRVEWSLQEIRPAAYGPWQQDFWARCQNAGPELSFHLPFTDIELASTDPELRGRSLSLVKHYIALTQAAHPSHYTLHLGVGGPGSPRGQWGTTTGTVSEAAALASLRELADLGRRQRFTIALENLVHGLTSDPETYRRLVLAGDVQATFDVGHARGSSWGRQGGDPDAYWAGLESRIVCIHIYEMETETGQHLPPQPDSPVLGTLLRRLWTQTAARCWVVELFTPDQLEPSLAAVRAFLPELAHGANTATPSPR